MIEEIEEPTNQRARKTFEDIQKSKASKVKVYE